MNDGRLDNALGLSYKYKMNRCLSQESWRLGGQNGENELRDSTRYGAV